MHVFEASYSFKSKFEISSILRREALCAALFCFCLSFLVEMKINDLPQCSPTRSQNYLIAI